MALRPSKFSKQVGNLTYREGKVTPIDIEVGSVVTMLTFKMETVITTPGAVPVGLTYAGLLGLIDEVKLRLQGRDDIIEISGKTLKRLMATDFGHDLVNSVPQITAGAQTYKFHFQLALFLPRSLAPGTTGLDLRGVDKCEMFVKWAGIDGVYQAPNSAEVTSVSLDIFAEGINNVPAEKTYMVRSLIENSHPIATPHDTYTAISVDNLHARLLNSVSVMGLSDGALAQIAGGIVRVRQGSFTRLESYSGTLSYNQSFETDTAYEPKVIPFDFSILGDTSMVPRMDELSHPLVFEMPVGKIAALPVAAKNELLVLEEILREARLT